MWPEFIALRGQGYFFSQAPFQESQESLTFNFLSLQFRQPNLDLRGALRSGARTGLGQVKTMLLNFPVLCAAWV